MTLEQIIDLVARRRQCSRDQARAVIAIMPGGVELLSGRIAPEHSPLAIELTEDEPG